jgi:hypothetical protein
LICRNLGEFCAAIEDGAGAALIAEEAVSQAEAAGVMVACLQRQPPWSDLPIVLVTEGRGHGGPEFAR